MCPSVGSRRAATLQPMRIRMRKGRLRDKMAGKVILCIYLGLCCYHDCKTKQIPTRLLQGGLVVGSLYAGILVIGGRTGWQAVPAGVLPGAVMILYSRLSGGKLGEADGRMVLPAGLMQGWERCTLQILTACFLVFFAAIFLVLTKKGTRRTRIPFAPFYLAAVVLLWTGEMFGGLVCG